MAFATLRTGRRRESRWHESSRGAATNDDSAFAGRQGLENDLAPVTPPRLEIARHRAYRDSQPGRPLTFAAAFNVGLLITLISCVFYVATWLVMYYQFMPDFADKYAARIVEGLRAKGAPQTQIDEAIKQGVQLKALLANPFMNAAMTFTEPFPVGLLVTLVSAATLRRKAE